MTARSGCASRSFCPARGQGQDGRAKHYRRSFIVAGLNRLPDERRAVLPPSQCVCEQADGTHAKNREGGWFRRAGWRKQESILNTSSGKPNSANLPGIVDRAGLLKLPTRIRGDQSVQVVHRPIAVEKRRVARFARIADNLSAVVDAKSCITRARSCIEPSLYRKMSDWYPEVMEAPAICPRLLMQKATLEGPPSVPNAFIVPLL